MLLTTFAKILFWTSICSLVYTYVIYPLLVRYLAKGTHLDTQQFEHTSELPQVSILMAIYNEEAVIEDKLNSLVQQEYTQERLHIYIGSDNSSDNSNKIIQAFAQKHPNIHFTPFKNRQGKPSIINQLSDQATQRKAIGSDHVFIITDASVMLTPTVCASLCKHFKHPGLAIVDARMVHTGMAASDISVSEDTYISWEGQLKYNEGVVWKKMIGPFGGCYAIRSDYFTPVPTNFLVDDFYITMEAFRKGGLAISEPQAVCYEAVGHEINEEFRRKTRISAGNLQNMFSFTSLWLPPWGSPNFAFFSHKILRWLGPIWLILLLLGSGLVQDNQIYTLLFWIIGSAYVLTPLVDEALKRMGIHWSLLRNVRYFLMMNLALLNGYFRYLKGIKSNVWQPPKRQ